MKQFWTSLASLLGVVAFCQSLLQVVFLPELYLSSFVSASASRQSQSFSGRPLPDEKEFWRSLASLTRAVNSSATTFGLSNNDCINDVFDGAAVQWVHMVTQRQSQSFSGRPLPDEEFWTSVASLTRAVNSSATTFGLSNNDCINDVSDGAAVQWVHVVTQRQSQSFSGRPPPDEKRGVKLRIRKRDKDLILDSYLDYIMDKANDIRRKNQERFLYNNSRGGSLDSRGHPWESVPFKHPSTFDMLAMDPERKRDIMEDLCDFAAGQAFYQRTGQAWKRGHLLYGPLGMRKSSAAMANFLGYDIYDLELTQVHSKSELLNLLVTTNSKSIIVIKDIDCLINLSNPSKVPQAAAPQSYNYPGAPDAMCGGEDRNNTTITFLGLLNFPDGLRSCCGDETIFIFTTNHIEKLDPELLQSSWMDVHICMIRRIGAVQARPRIARGHPWESVPFKHPSTFDTLAMDRERKRDVMEDLRDFAAGQAFYQQTGRAWKRGYLLYGPPGMGKLSMIAAMANFLSYDIYDLKLTKVHSNSEPRKLLMKTSSKSIIVMEDIDCSVNLSKRSKAPHASASRGYYEPGGPDAARGSGGVGNNNTITLSGLLNFTDSPWSCCGSERIFVFATNHIEKLDPTLLRSSRMDMHIYMSYCSYPALKILLRNYLGCEAEDLSDVAASELQEEVEKAKMTPADISEVLIKNRRNKERGVGELLEVLKARAERNEKYRGGLREECELNGVVVEEEEEEEEEQEKRALVLEIKLPG